MAEAHHFSIAEDVLGKIASSTLQEAIAFYNVKNPIRQLKNSLIAIMAVLLDAEEQQAMSSGLQSWLSRLQDMLYDAEDVLDELEGETLRKQVISRYGGIKENVRCFFSLSNPLVFHMKISHKIKKIQEILSDLCTEKDQFDLKVQSVGNGVAHTRSREMTYLFANKSHVIGREFDKKKIIDILMQLDYERISVIPIVGIRGSGKTTLAKLVYNDNGVKEKFDLRLWVCVPQDFDLTKIMKGIIKYATSQSSSNFNIRQLQAILRDTIIKRKFLLVLDDVWSIDQNAWSELRNLLGVGDSKSKIIVTTHRSDVASIMGTLPSYNLRGLSHEDSMALFKRLAFDEKEKESCPELLDIGNDIVKKSRGVPLLLKTLGSLLYTRNEKWYWARIRDSKTWKLVEAENSILPILKLSYDDLPSHLKRCFSMLSLFPKGDKITGLSLVKLWMALGLISPVGEKQALEDIGMEYVKELWKRSLIQVQESESHLFIKMHDLVHSLATSVANNYCSIVGLYTTDISAGVRYVCLSSTSLTFYRVSSYKVPTFLRQSTSKRLRVIKFETPVANGVITREFARICISRCKSLRYLDLSYGSFEELPSSIRNLKQLRSLHLQYNKQLKKLPDTICELQNLLHLSFHGCSELGDLPRNMKKLINLRHLYVTTKQKTLQETGIQYLENLHFLGLIECENPQVLLEGTYRRTHLRKLEIVDCRRQISLPFGELVSLEHMEIVNCQLMLNQENKFTFSSTLRKLVIAKFEQVMELLQCLEGSANTLETFSVYDCQSLTALPGWLPNHICLKLIRLIRCPNLLSMPQGIQSLTSLKKLSIEHCGELSKRCQPTTGEDWHKIAHVPQIELDLIRVQWLDD